MMRGLLTYRSQIGHEAETQSYTILSEIDVSIESLLVSLMFVMFLLFSLIFFLFFILSVWRALKASIAYAPYP